MRVITKTSVLCLAGALLLAAGLGPRQTLRADERPADLGASSPAMWRAFEPLVVAFGDGEPAAAVAYLRRANAILRKLEAQLVRDAAAETFRKRSLKSLEAFDLEEFYQLLPAREPDGFRAFSFEGAPAERHYQVRAGLRAPQQPRAFGESYGVVRMRPSGDDDEERYLLQLRGGAGLGPLRWQSLIAGAVNAGGLLEPPESAELPIALRAADAFLRKRQPELGAIDRRILALFWGSYPAASDVILPISLTDDVVAQDAPDDLSKLHLVTRWDLAGMGRRYPELARYFADLGDIADVRLRIADAASNRLASLHTDTRQLTTRASAVLRAGKVVATRAQGGVSEPRFERMRVTADLHFVLHRLRIAIEDLQIELHYQELADGFALDARAVGTPKVHVTGAAFGVLPARMLDWFIPGDAEGLARHMLKVSMAGNQGRGMRLSLRFKQSPAGANVDWQFETELLDTPLVRFCMKVISDAAIPSDAQEADLRRLASDYRDAFDRDLERFAKFGAR